jgi:WD40 repeat protein
MFVSDMLQTDGCPSPAMSSSHTLHRHFATGGTDAIFSLWDTAELICVRSFGRQEASVRSLSFSSDGRLLAVAADDVNLEIVRLCSPCRVW